MGYTTILDILSATIVGGLLMLILMRINGNVIENNFIHSRSFKFINQSINFFSHYVENLQAHFAVS